MPGDCWNLDELNRCDPAAFTRALGSVFEHSPWIAERAAARRPFASAAALHAALCASMRAASQAERLALLRAHPDLAGRLARSGQLTAESAREQASAGLDHLTNAELAELDGLNAAYRERFGFPFIICARLNSQAAILAALRTRLAHDPATEFDAALAEIEKIALLRLRDVVKVD